MLNRITVDCEGRTRTVELEKGQAEKFLYYANIASESDSVVNPPSPYPQEEGLRRLRRANTVEEGADKFKTYLSMIADLDVRSLARIIALSDLMEYGNCWMLETINDLLDEVLCEGPARANERNPRDVLAGIAFNLYDWWDDIDTARSRAGQHPRLFPTPATPEPPAAEQSTQPTTSKPAKAQSARKPRKKVKHAA